MTDSQQRRVHRDAQVADVMAAGFHAASQAVQADFFQQKPGVAGIQTNVGVQGLHHVSSELLLAELSNRGGHPGALADAALLCIKKSQDYNPGQSDPHKVDRTSYFPFGATSYAQMLHTKSQRFNSLVQKQQAAIQPNFEGLRDTALDIINYAGFYLADPRTPK